MSGIPTIGDVVREWRRYLQISLTEFSKETKLTKGYISELEHNKIDNPKPPKRKALAAALGISERDIVSRRMPPKSGEAEEEEDEDEDGGGEKRPNQKAGDHGRELESEPQSNSTPIPSIAHPVIDTQNVLLGTTGKEIERLLGSARLSEEEEKQIAGEVIEYTKRLLALNEALRTLRKSEESRQ